MQKLQILTKNSERIGLAIITKFEKEVSDRSIQHGKVIITTRYNSQCHTALNFLIKRIQALDPDVTISRI